MLRDVKAEVKGQSLEKQKSKDQESGDSNQKEIKFRV